MWRRWRPILFPWQDSVFFMRTCETRNAFTLPGNTQKKKECRDRSQMITLNLCLVLLALTESIMQKRRRQSMSLKLQKSCFNCVRAPFSAHVDHFWTKNFSQRDYLHWATMLLAGNRQLSNNNSSRISNFKRLKLLQWKVFIFSIFAHMTFNLYSLSVLQSRWEASWLVRQWFGAWHAQWHWRIE